MTSIATLHIDRKPRQIGTVKWFDASRGFGFVVVAHMSADFLLHKNTLQSFGIASISEGAIVEFDYTPSPNGFRITQIIDAQPAPETNEKAKVTVPDVVLEETVPARVKWFDAKKGYGFVNAFGSMDDIFVGASVLRQAMLSSLEAGQAVSVQIAITDDRKSVYRIHDWC